ncbi:tetratricopeptide repeat protein [Pseudoxanthomonas sp. Root630]|uniref:tetratricopeptide repeat protein n=1 Tax=Pseudoxanthomonas sp. Root630 TaxID=1736574 RepID=UPI000703B8AD|nr:tetratricopeptide repeat protein [Pseudoxanthomonas sp. Root630]KRA51638.1 hypothetical protein ASD72_00625 [Pseudoxanthomonas sp. Root630]
MSRPARLFLLFLGIALAIYWPGLSGPLVFDDHQNLAPLKEWLAGNTSAWRVIFDNASGLLGRQVSMASLVLNVQLLGPDIWGLKLGNLLIHLVNGVLVYLLFTRLARAQAPVQGMGPTVIRWMPCIVAGIWLLHPLQVSTTLYVIQRMAMLSALFTLGTLIAYIEAREALRDGRRARACVLFFLTGTCTLLAAFSKENGVLAPALCAIIEFWIFSPVAGRRRHPLSWLFITGALILPAVAGLALTAAQAPFIVAEYANRPFTLGERLMTQGRVLWDYVGALILPYGPRLGLYHDDYLVSSGWMSPVTTLAAWLGWLATLLVAWYLRKRAPGVGLGLGFYLIAQALESSVFPLLMYFEHRTYLPSAGALWAIASLVVLGAQHLSSRMDHPRRIFSIATGALLVVLSVATSARAYVWQSQHSLLAQGLEHHPDSRWLRADIAQDLMFRNPPDAAGAHIQVHALEASPQESTRRLAGVWQLLIDCSTGKPTRPTSKALAFGGVANDIEADLLVAFETLGNGILNKPCVDMDASYLGREMAQVADKTSVPQTHFNVRRLRFKAAQLYVASGDADTAIALSRQADSGTREDAPIGAFLAELLIAKGRIQEARPILLRLQSQVPRDDATGQAILKALEDRSAATTHH